MKIFKTFLLFSFLVLLTTVAFAQDAVIISDGNFVRGTIQGTDFKSVKLLQEDKTLVVYKAEAIKEFLWNGDTYVSKAIVFKKKPEYRFLKVELLGAVNLYSMGANSGETTPDRKVQIWPSLGVGIGTGGYGGVGIGAGISVGGGWRNRNKQSGNNHQAFYYLEKAGTSPIQAIPLAGNSAAKHEQVKALLLQELSDDEGLAKGIKATETFDAKNIKAIVSAYNDMHHQ